MGVKVRQKLKGKGKPWWVFISHNGKRTSRKIGDKYSVPINLGPNVNSMSWESQPSLSSDGKSLFFSSDRYGGKIGKGYLEGESRVCKDGKN